MTSKTISIYSAALAAVLMIPAASQAEMSWSHTAWDSDGDMEITDSEFATGFSDSGTYGALDRDGDMALNESEFATGFYSNWDMDDDPRVTEAEYDAGVDRWYGSEYNTPFSDYDLDSSGYIDGREFGEGWDSGYYRQWDVDGDSVLTEAEYSTGVFNNADLDSDQVITVEEEGWFEGWFDGDDIEAEVEEVGDII